MADIDVVPKRRTNTWVWVLLALAVIAVLWFAFGRSGQARTGGLSSAAPAVAHVAPPHLDVTV